MIKVGDKVRILENCAGSLMLHYFHVGDIVKVRVLSVDVNKKRIALTMKNK